MKTDGFAEQGRPFEEPIFGGLSFVTVTNKASHREAMEARALAEYERDRDGVLIGCGLDARR